MERDEARWRWPAWRGVGVDGTGMAKAWHRHGACVHLSRDGEVARVLPAREHLLPRGCALHHGLDEAGRREGEQVEPGEGEREQGAPAVIGSGASAERERGVG